MAGLNAEQFSQQVRQRCEKSKIVVRVLTLSESIRHTRLRIFLNDRSFVDIYYNQETGKTAYAQIFRANRIFGADNTNGVWHWHPRKDPSNHVPADSKIGFDEFFKGVEQNTV